MDEVERLRSEISELNATLSMLRSNYSAVLESLPEYVALRDRVSELEAQLNSTLEQLNSTLSENEALKARVSELESELVSLRGEVRWVYRILGVGVAVGILIGFVLGRYMVRRREGKGG